MRKENNLPLLHLPKEIKGYIVHIYTNHAITSQYESYHTGVYNQNVVILLSNSLCYKDKLYKYEQ